MTARLTRKRSSIGVVLTVALPLLLVGCGLLGGDSEPTADGDGADQQADSLETAAVLTTTTLASGPGGGDLEVDLFNNGVYCDGTARPAALIFGGEPGEIITFSTPMPVDIDDGVADDQGAFQLQWSCEPHETALFWDLTATGSTSKRSATFQIRGSGDQPLEEKELVFVPGNTPLLCNNTRQIVGWVEGTEPGETVSFTSPDVDDLVEGSASLAGRVEVNWSCAPEETGESWPLTAKAVETGRTVTFTVAGSLPEPVAEGPIQAAVAENPFVCDRSRRTVAQLVNLTPGASVAFEATPGGVVPGGRATLDGTLDVFWVCTRDDDGTQWTITATEVGPPDTESRAISFSFTGSANPNPTTVAFLEDPFVCDGTRHPVATLSNFLANEFIDFTSPQSQGLRQGQAGTDGSLIVNWQCGADDVGRKWEVTATGATSGVDITFTITGAPASE